MLIIEEPGAKNRREQKRLILVIAGVLAALLLLVGVGVIIADRITEGGVLGWFSEGEEMTEEELNIFMTALQADGYLDASGNEPDISGSGTGEMGYGPNGAKADPNAPSVEEVVKEVGKTYKGDLYSDGYGAQAFADYVFQRAYDGEITFGTAYKYFEDMLPQVDPSIKSAYYYGYAQTYYKLDRKLDGAIEVFERAEPSADADANEWVNYYVQLRQLSDTAGDATKFAYYDDKVRQVLPEVEPVDYDSMFEDN